MNYGSAMRGGGCAEGVPNYMEVSKDVLYGAYRATGEAMKSGLYKCKLETNSRKQMVMGGFIINRSSN